MSAEITKLTPAASLTPTVARDTTHRIAGGKVGVLLIHGLCGTPAEMRFVAMGLARAGYTVHCPTLAGHGGTRQDIVNTTWQDWYQSAEAALNEISKECDTVIVGGLCLGSIIGLHLAANNRDKVQGVALFSPTLWINGWAMPWYTKFFSLVRTRWMANMMEFPDAASLGIKCPRVREFVRAALAASDGSDLGTVGTPGAMLLEHRRLVSAAKKLLGRIDQPTLIVHSRQDDYADLNNATYVQANLTAPVDLVVLEDSYHMVTLDKERHVVVEKTRSFVARIAESIGGAVAANAGAMAAA
ncbi:alpha/beta fold hydrolase [Hyphomicrobium sp.]|uniref:alpha/beta hydrolase n=1 Tax=Hyphomicrobium sp. TaxID=82 RepID=UPI001D779729|nr:alpha/beta fold hydrolase [Hyphomicrobium sp.]MBY0560288.1 alpha/beta fold hydrolase [Hyphomicrobium sp.]